ncbi:MAG: choice-of-anchor D domain-containing protein [Actinobacteria bacterium]|nr:choice-of-anchor D domain-containing protein [Actinomycetota bacterium]
MNARPAPRRPLTRGAASLRRLALALSLSLLAFAAFGATGANAYLYWTGTQGTSVNRTTTSGVEETREWVEGIEFPHGVALDASHIYWANFGTSSIGRANLAGKEVEPKWIEVRGILGGNPEGVAVDVGHVYWANFDASSIGRANLKGGEVEPEWIPGANNPTGVAVDAGHVYWTSFGANSIGRADLAGGDVKQEWITGAKLPEGIAVNAGHVYWANYTTSSIGRANLAGGEVEQGWITGAKYPRGLAIDAGHVYWANHGTDSIGRATLTGGEIEPEFRKAPPDIWGVAVGYQTADPSTASLSFGSVVSGSLGAPQSVTFTNHGNQNLIVNGFALGGADPAQFLLEAGSCGAPVPPGGSCSVGVRFAPQAVGTFSATLTARTETETDPVVSLGGSGGTPPPPQPLPAPKTSVKSGPAGRSSNRRPRFAFGSNQKGVTFLCRLDKQKFHPCKAKVTLTVKPGHHVLRVKAVGPTGVVDPTAAKRSFVVVAGKGS